MEDLFSSYKGPGLIGMLLGILVLACFVGLGLAVFDGRLNGSFANSLQKKVVAQADEIKRLEGRAAHLDEAIVENRKKRRQRAEIDVLARRAELMGKSGAELATAIKEEKEEIEQLVAAKRDYRQDYREAIRARAEGGTLAQLETISGTTYRSVTINNVNPLGITIIHTSGIKRIPYAELPRKMQDFYQFGEEEAAAHRAEERKVADAVKNRMKKEGDRKEALREKLEAQAKADDRAKWKRKIVELQTDIRSAQARVLAEEKKEAEFRRMHADAVARGNVSSHLSSAKKADDKANLLRRQIGNAQNQVAELKRLLSESD